MTQVADAPAGRSSDHRYRSGARIADGGMATVYQAVDERLGRTVAVKVMHRQLAQGPHHDQFVERFHREARSAASIANPHIVQVYDTGEYEGLGYLVMEYVHGVTLRQAMRTQRTFSVRETLRILLETLDGLASAHRAGVIHRDITPENLLINDRGHVQITDFGLAKAISQETLSSTGMLLGTASYLAPEMIAENRGTPQGDLYAVGIVGWEMLAGEVPFPTSNPVTMVFKHVHEDVPGVQTRCPGVDPSVARFLSRLTARDLAQRPADAVVAHQDLHELMTRLDTTAWGYRRDPASLAVVGPLNPARPHTPAPAAPTPGTPKAASTSTTPTAISTEARQTAIPSTARGTTSDTTATSTRTPPSPPSSNHDAVNATVNATDTDTLSPSSGADEPRPMRDGEESDDQVSPTASFDAFLTRHLGNDRSDTDGSDTDRTETDPSGAPRRLSNRDRGHASNGTRTQSFTDAGYGLARGHATTRLTRMSSTQGSQASTDTPSRTSRRRLPTTTLAAVMAAVLLVQAARVQRHRHLGRHRVEHPESCGSPSQQARRRRHRCHRLQGRAHGDHSPGHRRPHDRIGQGSPGRPQTRRIQQHTPYRRSRPLQPEPPGTSPGQHRSETGDHAQAQCTRHRHPFQGADAGEHARHRGPPTRGRPGGAG